MAYQLEDDEDYVGAGVLPSVTDLPPAYSGDVEPNATVPSEADYAAPALRQQADTAVRGQMLAEVGDMVSEEEADRVQGLVAQKRMELAYGLSPGQDPAEVYAVQLSDAGKKMFADAFARSGQTITTTSPRPGYGPTKEYTDTMLGGRRRPVTDPFGRPVYQPIVSEETSIDPRAMGAMDPSLQPWEQGPAQQQTQRVVRQGPQLFERDPGLLEEQKVAARRAQAAQINTAQTQADLLQEAYDRQVQLDQQIAGREMRRMQRIEEQRAQVDKSFDAVRKATQEMLDSAEIDPDKGWEEKGVGAKILAILGSAMMGFAGMDGMAHINAVIQNSIDAQKANQDRARARVMAAQGMQQSAESSWGALREQLGDEATADEAFRLRSLLAIGAKAEAILADAQVNELTAAQEKFMVDLRTQIAESELKLKLTAAANTPTITRTRSAMTPGQAALNQAMGKAGIGLMEKGATGAVDIVANRQTQTREIGAKREEEEAKRAAAAAAPRDSSERRVDFNQMQYLSDNTKRPRQRLRGIHRFRQKYGADEESGNIPGVSWVDRFVSGGLPRALLDEAGREARSELKRIYLSRLREETGAAYNTKEEMDVAEQYANDFDEADVFNELEAQERIDVDSVRDTSRAVEREVRARWFGTTPDLLPYFKDEPADTTGLATRADARGKVDWEDEE